MTLRAHAALWIAGIACALAAEPLLSTDSEMQSFEAGTRAWVARSDPRIAASAGACADAIAPRWAQGTHRDRAAAPPSVRGGLAGPVTRWLATWRTVVLRMALLACEAARCWPVLLAGLVDGLAMRRARRGRFPAMSPLASGAARHGMIVLVFAPMLWAALPMDVGPLALPAWALVFAGTLSFTLSRAGTVAAA